MAVKKEEEKKPRLLILGFVGQEYDALPAAVYRLVAAVRGMGVIHEIYDPTNWEFGAFKDGWHENVLLVARLSKSITLTDAKKRLEGLKNSIVKNHKIPSQKGQLVLCEEDLKENMAVLLDSLPELATREAWKDSSDEIKKNLLKGVSLDELEKPRVAVLGSFDTWPYVDHVCRQIVKLLNVMAVTSRGVYSIPSGTSEVVKQKLRFNSSKLSLNEVLTRMIFEADAAVIVYSNNAGNIIETDWCKEKKPTVGIAMVRSIRAGDCPSLIPGKKSSTYTVCKRPGNSALKGAWRCINFSCPFSAQDMTKMTLDCFADPAWGKAKLCAVETVEAIDEVITNELKPLMGL